MGAFNAINHYGKHAHWEEMAAARKDLRAVAERFPDNPKIQQARALGESVAQKLRRPGT